eukprot:TRINITY_DN8011_c0_g1_i1.p1 TRINITY_DN8011_c0_g1~~TRINITY_DN8011_c0_g1_i1.p1  ORF type:complete len:388 (-),score=126.70 TRINITY_DN8011_c0_g1_i1:278-1441(-)
MHRFALFVVSALCLVAGVVCDGVWTYRRNMLYKRSDFTANVVPGFPGGESMMVLVGGCTANGACDATGNCPCTQILNYTTAYNPVKDTWAEIAQAPVARFRHSSAVVGSKLYVFGGRALDDSLISQVDVFDATTGTWSTTKPWPSPTSDLASFVYNNIIYAISGYDANYASLASTWLFVPANNSWIPGVVRNLPLGRGDTCATIVQGKGYLLGGWNDGDGFCTPLDDVTVYDFVANNWTSVGNMHHPAGDKSCGTLHDQLHAFGGEEKNNGCSNVSTPIDDSEVYNVTSNTWTVETPMPISRFRFAAVTWLTPGTSYEQVFVFGGQAPYNTTLRTLQLLDIVTVFTDDIPARTTSATTSRTTDASAADAPRSMLVLTVLVAIAVLVL